MCSDRLIETKRDRYIEREWERGERKTNERMKERQRQRERERLLDRSIMNRLRKKNVHFFFSLVH